MKQLSKTLFRDLAVLAAGILLWVGFVAFGADASWYITPPMLVILMMLYIVLYSALAFFVHRRAVAGIPWEDEHERRRPSMVIPSVTTIVLMIFVVAWIVQHQAIWTVR